MAGEWEDAPTAKPASAASGGWENAPTAVEKDSPRWDLTGDIGRAASASGKAAVSDFSEAFPSAATRRAQSHADREKYGIVGEAGMSFVHDAQRAGSAVKSGLDALGVLSSPLTGALHSTLGSALSYLPGVTKKQADEGVDQAMLGAAPRGMRAGLPKPPPAIPEGYNILRDSQGGGVDQFGVPKGDPTPIPAGFDPKRNVEKAAHPTPGSTVEKQTIPDTFDVMGNQEHATQPNTEIAAGKARRAGYVLPPAMVKDNPGVVADLLSGAGGKTQLWQHASTKNQAVTNRLAAESLGLGQKQALGPAVFDAVRAKASKAYEAVAELMPSTKIDGDFKQALSEIGGRNGQAAKHFPKIVKNEDIENLVESLGEHGEHGEFPTQAGLDLVRHLRFNASQHLKTIGDPAKHALGLAEREAAEAMDELIERNIGRAEAEQRFDPRIGRYLKEPDPRFKQLGTAYRNARTTIARSYDVEGATDIAGNVSAPGLAKLARNGRPLSDQLAQIAEAGDHFQKAMQNPSRFGSKENVSMLDFFGSAASIMHGNPGFAAALSARRPIRAGILSNRFQNSLVRPPGYPAGVNPPLLP